MTNIYGHKELGWADIQYRKTEYTRTIALVIAYILSAATGLSFGVVVSQIIKQFV